MEPRLVRGLLLGRGAAKRDISIRASPHLPRPMLIQEIGHGLSDVVGELVDEKVPARERRRAQIGATLAPFSRNIEQLSHLSRGSVESQRRTLLPLVDIGGVVLEVDARSRAIIGARP